MEKIDDPSGIPSDDFQREGLIDRLRQYLEAEPKAWHVRYNLGVALAHAGEVDQALDEFRQVLAVSPKHLESMVNIGGIHLSRGDADQALKVLTSALSVWDLPVVRANLAVAFLQKDRLQEAERELKKALEMNPGMPDAWANLGSVYLRQGQLEASVEASRKSLEIRPDMALAHNNLAAALQELGQTDQAREHARQALAQGWAVHQDLLELLDLSENA